MAGFKKVLDYLKLTDEDDEFDDDFYDDYDDDFDERELEKENKRVAKEKKKEAKRPAASSYREDDYYEEEKPPMSARRTPYRSSSDAKVLQMPNKNVKDSDLEVCIVKPTNIGESQQVCDLLMNSNPVIVNLEGIDLMEAQRIMDFISGCIFAIAGNMCQVSRYIFIFSPKGVEISGDYLKSLENAQSYNIANFNKEF